MWETICLNRGENGTGQGLSAEQCRFGEQSRHQNCGHYPAKKRSKYHVSIGMLKFFPHTGTQEIKPQERPTQNFLIHPNNEIWNVGLWLESGWVKIVLSDSTNQPLRLPELLMLVGSVVDPRAWLVRTCLPLGRRDCQNSVPLLTPLARVSFFLCTKFQKFSVYAHHCLLVLWLKRKPLACFWSWVQMPSMFWDSGSFIAFSHHFPQGGSYGHLPDWRDLLCLPLRLSPLLQKVDCTSQVVVLCLCISLRLVCLFLDSSRLELRKRLRERLLIVDSRVFSQLLRSPKCLHLPWTSKRCLARGDVENVAQVHLHKWQEKTSDESNSQLVLSFFLKKKKKCIWKSRKLPCGEVRGRQISLDGLDYRIQIIKMGSSSHLEKES